MPKLVLHGATLKCDQGSDPSKLSVHPDNRTDGDAVPAATVMDKIPTVNIAAFGTCSSQKNPSAPCPCTPSIDDPWSPGSTDVRIAEIKALTSTSTCKCTLGGTIAITDPASDIDLDPG
jgi:hypothetical protein